jgi:FkbM family methyltransferase
MMDSLEIYDIWRLLDYPRAHSEAEIRAMCRTVYLGDSTVLARVLGRYKMFVDTRDTGISTHLMLEGYWEMWVTEAMLRHVRRGSTVIDVGANLGYYTILMADLTGAEGRVLAFEPNPALVQRAERSVAVNGMGNFTTVHACAVGDEDGFVTMTIPEFEPGGAQAKATAKGTVAGANTMPVRRLDSFPEALDAELIKIDVEGYEREVFRGMRGILDRGHPLTLFMEFTVARYPDPVGFLHEILAEGFTFEIIDYLGGIRPTTIEEIMGRSHIIDHMLCFRRGQVAPRTQEPGEQK